MRKNARQRHLPVAVEKKDTDLETDNLPTPERASPHQRQGEVVAEPGDGRCAHKERAAISSNHYTLLTPGE
jgi:hypothetical protein